MERRPKWAWELAPWSESLWDYQYHANPLDHLLDPRRHDSTKISEPEPLSSTSKPKLDGPATGVSTRKPSLERMRYDERLYQLTFGRVQRRPPSPDNAHLDDDGCDSSSLPYRTHPYDQRKKYKPRTPTEQLHFERLNATQFKVYASKSDCDEQSDKWLRVGSLYHDHIEALHRQEQGDVSSTDQQGLRYQLEKRILENKAGPVSERWTKKQIRRGRYYVASLLESMTPDTEFYRADLFIYNTLNHDNLQSLGMDCLTTVFEQRDVTGKIRRDKPCQVLIQLSRFDNLCPLYEDRQLLRLMLGRGDELNSSSCLLSPLDAARMSQSMLILPRQERDLSVFKSTLSGAPIGLIMASSQISTQSVYSDEVTFPALPTAQLSYAPVKPTASLAERKNMQAAQSTAKSAATTYRATCANFPDRPVSPLIPDIPPRSSARQSPPPIVLIDEKPDSSAVHPSLHGSGSNPIPATPPRPETSPTSTSSPFERLQEAFSRIVEPIPPVSLEDFPSWLYIFATASADSEPEVLDPSLKFTVGDNVSSASAEYPAGFPSLSIPPPIHTCEPDPRTHYPPHYVHPPMALGVHLYDDYDSAVEDSDDDILRVYTPPPRFDTPSPDDSPRLFSGLQTPESAESPSDTVFQYPPIVDKLESSAPHATSTPTMAKAMISGSDTRTKYLQGPPGHRKPELEDFSLNEPAPIFTCETQQEHSSNLFFMFVSRIIYRGSRKELFMLSMSYPDAALYLNHARCLRGLTAAQKQRVIGPFTPEQVSAFRARFHPLRLKYTRRLEVFDRLYSIEIPDNGEDFKAFVPNTPPAFKYIAEKRLREVLFHRRYTDPDQLRFGQSTAEYVTESITETDEEMDSSDNDVFDPVTTDSSSFDVQDYVLNVATYSNGTSATGHYLGEIWGPYFDHGVLQDIPLDLSFDDFLEELDVQIKHGPIQVDPGLATVPLDDPSAEAALSWARNKLSEYSGSVQDLSVPPSLSDSDSNSSDEYSTTEDALTDSDDNEEDISVPLTGSVSGFTVKDYRFKDQEKVQRNLDRAGRERSTTQRSQFVLPSTVVLVPYGHHQHETTRKGQVTMDFLRSVSIHPVNDEMFLVDYDLAPETYLMFQSREFNRSMHELHNSVAGFSKEIGTLAQFVKMDTKTGIPYFPAGTLTKIFQQFLGPRTVTLGYQKLVSKAKIDSRSPIYPGVLNVLRGNVNLSLLPLTKLTSYAFLRKDSRFKDSTEVVSRPQIFYYTIKMLEPTHFSLTSQRHWVVLLSDVDVHSWTPVSSFALLCGKLEVILKNQRLSAPDAVPEKVGVAHYHPSRPGLPESFVLSASVGSFRPSEEQDSRCSPYFTRWLMRHNGRVLVTLFVGAVQREISPPKIQISPSQARKTGITADAYHAALADQRDLAKFYETRTAPDGRVVRVRRTDVFPKTLIGTYRPVYGPVKGSTEPALLFYEKVLWPGIGFDHRVINVEHPNYVSTMHGGRFNVSKGGPRLLLLNANPMEKEMLDSFVSLPAFILDNWDEMCARARHDHPGSRALLRKASLLPVDFSPEMLPPLWFKRFQLLRNYFGKDMYLMLERLIIAMEMDSDLHPPYLEDSNNAKKLDHLHPYSFPHLENHHESLVRITSQGVVSYRAEENEILRRMPDVLSQMTGHSVPQSGCCYGRFYANSTRTQRSSDLSATDEGPDVKPHL
ncbi:unnamed protein product [Oikopleura dioica]|uniref:Uncharacterized protein n=1 Tax=Oikopleura dioica TaxID=34765 RepID=E4XS41_OIKDI|nr:unnamed protein product [Oikopleura dioica]